MVFMIIILIFILFCFILAGNGHEEADEEAQRCERAPKEVQPREQEGAGPVRQLQRPERDHPREEGGDRHGADCYQGAHRRPRPTERRG